MSNTILELAYRLTQAGEPFVLATVVWCERPTSAKPGAQAIIQADGTITGWIGGSCAQPVVLREALRILSQHYSIVQTRQLFHNRQEVTVVAAYPRPARR